LTQPKPAPDLEHVKCNLCASQDTKLVYKAAVLPHRRGLFARDEWEIVQCRQCGLIYLNPRPGPNSLAEFYAFENPDDRFYAQEWFIEHAEIQQSTWQRLLRSLQVYCSSGTLLDVGCGAGSFLEISQKAGFEVTGQEVSPYFYRYGRQERGLNILLGEVEDLNLPPASFDCITAFDVIEHHPDPTRMLKSIRTLIKDDGLLVLGTHDIGNFFARLYGVKWRYISPTGHLTYFSRKSLQKLVEKNGFQVIRQSGLHTVDATPAKEFANTLVQFVRLTILRGLILYLYKPLSSRLPFLTRWEFRWRGAAVNHEKLIRRAGKQIAMNDNLVLFARPKPLANR